jgi:adenylate kinase
MILFFGPAGAGKSVQGQLLASAKGWQWISTGNLFRESQDPKIQAILAGGSLVSSEITQDLLAGVLDTTRNQQVILDGFPRKIEQVEWLVDHQTDYDYTIDLVVVMKVSKQEILNRLATRGRAEDDPAIIEKRLQIYHDEVDPILAYLVLQEVPVVHVDGVGEIDDVHNHIMDEIHSRHLG